ncbi:hypothetical protein BGZ98_005275, partial [Dissophora globulifera]
MSTKSGSTYFSAVQKASPQAGAFDRADLNHDDFFVAYNNISLKGKTYCEFASYQDLSTFLQAYSGIADKERCFNETIRDGRACAEYYDIDWKLEARNRFAPEYPVLEEQCRVLGASSSSILSLHIIIPQYVFENNNKHMKAFMDNFKAPRGGDKGLTKYINTEVYTKNRGIRILGSCKRINLTRKLGKADWHAASKSAQDNEFYITNIGAEHTRVGLIEPVKKSKGKIVVSRTGQIAKIPVEEDAKVPQSVVDAVQVLFLKCKHANQFEFKYD